MLKARMQVRAGAAIGLLAVACGGSGEPSRAAPLPETGTLDVVVLTTGGDPDNDGYDVYVDGALHVVTPTRPGSGDIGTNRIDLGIANVPTGAHTVRLDRIASNCILSGTNPRQFAVTAGQLTTVNLAVECLATGIEVSAHTTGVDTPLSYDLIVDGRSVTGVTPNGTADITRLSPGSHVLTIGVPGENCTVPGGRQVSVPVASRSIASVAFDVACVKAVRREKIAYVVDTTVGGVNGPWVVINNPDGTTESAVVQGDHPTWSPDGTRLAYSGARCDGYAQYYGYPCTGGIGVIDPDRWTSSVMPDGLSGLTPAWAPAGETVAFTRCCSAADRGQVYLGSADGQTPVTSFHVDVDIDAPSWSPDGQSIVFSCTSSTGRDADLCVAGKDGTNFRRLGVATPAAPAAPTSPAWSPDGKRIAFTRASSPAPKREVALYDLSTRVVTTLTEGFDPAWSPDGTKLVVAAADGLYVINADGSRRTRITQGGRYAPAWRR